MADRPIPFSAPMIAAILRGDKSQTRRLMPQQEALQRAYAPILSGTRIFNYAGEEQISRAPYAKGDRLYVREEYYQRGHWEPVEGQRTKGGRQKWAFTPADDVIMFDAPADHRKGRHHADPGTVAWHKRLGRFMPRSASRMTLTVTDVRVERLNDCSEADAIAEGVAEYPCEGLHRGPDATYWTAERGHPEHGARTTPVAAYRALWETINGEGSWEANPWIVAVSFTVEQRNIDA